MNPVIQIVGNVCENCQFWSKLIQNWQPSSVVRVKVPIGQVQPQKHFGFEILFSQKTL